MYTRTYLNICLLYLVQVVVTYLYVCISKRYNFAFMRRPFALTIEICVHI